jgi:hypothetical protein
MVVAPEVHTPHHHAHTGHRWFDFVMGGSALLISVISLYVAVHHGETMEKLVQANSFPSIEFGADVTDGGASGNPVFRLTLVNDGVGPARVETLQIWNGDTPVTTADQIGKIIKANGDGSALKGRLEGDTVVGSLVGAGKSKTLVSIAPDDGQKWYLAFARTALSLRTRVCYCSVFDECYAAENGAKAGRPVHVKTCAAPDTPYVGDLSSLVEQNSPAPAK